jgi:hypothetical protein
MRGVLTGNKRFFAVEPVQRSCDRIAGKGIMLGLTAPIVFFSASLSPVPGGPNRFLNLRRRMFFNGK